MIVDDLSQANKYVILHPRFKQAFEFLTSNNLEALSLGKHIIDGDNLFAIVVNEEAVPMLESTSQFECHNQYIDIQYVFGE
jgi:YhcH/YjgK/YiaL family protein